MNDRAGLVPDLEAAHDRLKAAGQRLVVPFETKTYRTGNAAIRVDQFVVADPDGYLIRLQRHH